MSFRKRVSSRFNLAFKGTNELSMALKKRADLGLVKQVIKLNTSEMQQAAQRNAPVDTGTLKRGILMTAKDNGLTGRVYSRANYSGYVEFGTRFMYAQPYMRPAFNEQKKKFKQDMKRIMK